MTAKLQSLAPNLWLLGYPLKMLGADLRRNVNVIRLASGKLIMHSTAPFSHADVAAITALGEPAWLLETLLRHDTFAREGRAAFPDATYLAPAGFAEATGVTTSPLLPPPVEWTEEIDVALIKGAPDFSEIVLLHRPSRTLVVADLIIHFPGKYGFWKSLFLKIAVVGPRHDPGVTRPFKKVVEDFAAYEASVRGVLAWDFDRIIVGHSDVIHTGGKEALRRALEEAGMISA